MANGYWLFLILLLSIIVITFFLVKERGILYGTSPPTTEGYANAESIVLAPENLAISVNGKTFTPPSAGTSDLTEYINYISTHEFPTKITVVPETVNPIGNFQDGAARRLPFLVDGGKNNPESCRQKAKSQGHLISGVQWYGECWGGDDVDLAKSYGANPNYPNTSDFNYGRGWNNYITVSQPTINASITGYSDLVKWFIENGIYNYTDLKTYTGKSGFQGKEGFVEGLSWGGFSWPVPSNTQGAVPSNTQGVYGGAPPGGVISSNSPTAQTGTTSIMNNSQLTTLANSYKFTLSPGEDAQLLLKELKMASDANYSYDQFFKICTNYKIKSTIEVKKARNVLTSIGFDTTNTILDGITYMNSIGVTKENLFTDSFVKPYQAFNLGPDNKKLPGVIKLAYTIGVSEKTGSKFRFADFVSATQKLDPTINASNYDTQDGYRDLITTVYGSRTTDNASSDDFNTFISSVKNFDNTQTSGIGALRNFRDKVITKYGMTGYTAYKNMLIFLSTNHIKIIGSMSDFMSKFYKYYDLTSYAYNNPQGAGGHKAFDQCIQNFVKEILNQNRSDNPFKLTKDYNFSDFIDRLNSMNVQMAQITSSTDGKKTYEDYLRDSFTGYTPGNIEPFSGVSIVEGNVPGGYTNHLKNMGANTLDSIDIGTGASIKENDLDSLLQSTFGATSQENKMKVIQFYDSIGMQTTDITECNNLLKNFGINSMNTLNTLKQSLNDIHLTNYQNIKHFLNTIYNFGVKFSTLNAFTKDLSSFGVDFNKNQEKFYNLLKVLTNYDITYTKSTYDSCNTKFSNFVNNLVSDSVTIIFFDLIVSPLLKVLNDGVEPTNPPSNAAEKNRINRNMRDLIILRSKSLYDGTSFNQDSGSFGKCNIQIPANPPMTSEFKSDKHKYTITGGTRFLVENHNGKDKPMFLNEIIPDDYLIDPIRLKKRLFYAYVLAQKNLSNKGPIPIPFNYHGIVSLLTPKEYTQFKTPTPQLIPSSVMSALYANIRIKMNQSLAKNDYSEFNSYIDTANFIRTLPYYSFRLIASEIYSNTDDKGKTPKYDDYQDIAYRSITKGVAPFYDESAILESPYFDDYTNDYNSRKKTSLSIYNATSQTQIHGPVDATGIYVPYNK